MIEMITPEELIAQKKKVDILSKKAKKSYKTLMDLCNEMSFRRDLNIVKNASSETDNLADNLIYVLSDRIANHLTYSRSFMSAYEEYSEMLEKLFRQERIEDE
ncbi:MAG: hypothetical protein JSW00_12850 [Thermoplasmata archaeon]|nr:MAG: hypothetical protein JSW00_12850 [Thermoplasmata archaeon]